MAKYVNKSGIYFFFQSAIIISVNSIVAGKYLTLSRWHIMGVTIVSQELLRRVPAENSETLSYYLLESEETLDDDRTYWGYGIRIQAEKSQEEDSIRGISSIKEVTLDILHTLADGGAYPVHLRDIIYDSIE